MKKIVVNKIISWIWIGCVLGIWSIFLWNRIDYQLDSDMSSELILGNILSKEHGLLTDKWINGYATFWNGNIMTELSDGKIDVWATSCADELFKKDNINRWLQLSDHVESKPEGKIFVLLGQEEYAGCSQLMPPLQDADFNNEGYIIYIFERADDFLGLAEKNI